MKKKIAILGVLILVVGATVVGAQTVLVNRGAARYALRGLLSEEQTAALPDTTANTILDIAQRSAAVSLGEYSYVAVDTIVTTGANLRYPIVKYSNGDTDTAMAGKIAAVIYKGVTAAGGKERALQKIPPDMLGAPGAGQAPSFYAVVGRHLLLGNSPSPGETLFVYMLRVPRALDNDTVTVGVAREDWPAVLWLAAAMASMRDMQLARAQLFYSMYADHVRAKRLSGSPPATSGSTP